MFSVSRLSRASGNVRQCPAMSGNVVLTLSLDLGTCNAPSSETRRMPVAPVAPVARRLMRSLRRRKENRIGRRSGGDGGGKMAWETVKRERKRDGGGDRKGGGGEI